MKLCSSSPKNTNIEGGGGEEYRLQKAIIFYPNTAMSSSSIEELPYTCLLDDRCNTLHEEIYLNTSTFYNRTEREPQQF